MSQGGFISLRVALIAPERVRGLILLDSQAGTEIPETVPLYQGMVDEWVAKGPSDDIAAVTAGLIIGEPSLNEVWIPCWKARPHELLAHPGEALLTRDDITGRLDEIDAPALVVHGTADVAIAMDRAEALSAGLSGSTGVVPVEAAPTRPISPIPTRSTPPSRSSSPRCRPEPGIYLGLMVEATGRERCTWVKSMVPPSRGWA
jgi:3-oxoadipate enol-lactonase